MVKMSDEYPTGDVHGDETMSDGMMSDSEPDYSSLNTTPQSFDDFDRWQAHIGLKTFGEGLQAAAQAIFPNESRSRYTKVYVLMIYWENQDWQTEDPTLRISREVSNLQNTFVDIYNFQTEVWTIPDESCHLEVNQKILDFVKLGGDSDDHLKIVYYAGHTKLTKNRRLAWTRYVSRPSLKQSLRLWWLTTWQWAATPKLKVPYRSMEWDPKRVGAGAKRRSRPA